MKNDLYVSLNELVLDKTTDWTFIKINLTYPEIAQKGVVLWCNKNLEGKWTMISGNKFGFEDSTDALSFKLQFGM